MADTRVDNVVHRCKEILARHYGPRLTKVLRHGSEVRGEATSESDIDLLVVLRGRFNHFEELETIIDLLHEEQLTSDRYISARPADIDEFEAGTVQFYRNVKREGIGV